jgi:TRAP-type C4-dicarboxylate transport system substrate-binding protein
LTCLAGEYTTVRNANGAAIHPADQIGELQMRAGDRGVVVFLAATLLLTGWSVGATGIPPAHAEQAVKLVLYNQFPPNHPSQTATKKWMENITKASGGSVTFQEFTSGFGSFIEAFKSIGKGSLDIEFACPNYVAGMVPLGNAMTLPFALTEYQDQIDAWFNTKVPDILNRAYAAHNVRYLGPMYPVRELFLIRKGIEVTRLSDLRGRKVREAGGILGPFLQGLGMSPIQILTTETYVATQRGTVDALLFPVYTLNAYKLAEVVGEIVKPVIVNIGCGMFIGLPAWKKLSAAQQKALMQGDGETIRWVPTYLSGLDEEYIDMAVKKGAKVVTLPPEDIAKMREAAQAAYKKYVDEAGPEAKELLDLVVKQR